MTYITHPLVLTHVTTSGIRNHCFLTILFAYMPFPIQTLPHGVDAKQTMLKLFGVYCYHNSIQMEGMGG